MPKHGHRRLTNLVLTTCSLCLSGAGLVSTREGVELPADSLTRHRGRRQMVAAVAAEKNQKAACTPVPGLARTPLQVDWPSSETGAS